MLLAVPQFVVVSHCYVIYAIAYVIAYVMWNCWS